MNILKPVSPLRKFHALPILLALSSLAFPVLTAAQFPQEESSVECNELTEPLTIAYGQYTTNCEIETDPPTPTDLDRFEFSGNTGDQIRINILSLTGGLDPRLEMRNPSGTLVEDTSCHGNDTFGRPTICSFSVGTTLESTGIYSLSLSDVSINDTGAYLLQIERITPPLHIERLTYNAAIEETIDPATDTDFLCFDGSVNTNIRIGVLSLTGGLDPRLEIRDPSGTVIEDTSCHGNDTFGRPTICSFSVDAMLESNGAYNLNLSDVSINDTGNYEINLQCIFGNCPTLSTEPCDTQDPPATIAMLDIDASGEVGALTDGLILLRYFFGFSLPALTDGAVSLDAKRSPQEIQAYLQQLEQEHCAFLCP